MHLEDLGVKVDCITNFTQENGNIFIITIHYEYRYERLKLFVICMLL